MIIERPVYYIIWKERPIQFMTEDNSPTDYLRDACMYDSQKEAEDVIKTYDDPDEFEVIDGQIVVQI